MKLSKPGAGFVLGHEAVYLEAYRDPVGIWTIGGGHTAMAGGIKPRRGMIISFARALQIFAEDMVKYEGRVIRALKDERIAAPHRFDAMVSFDFNTGSIFKGTVDDKLNRGDVAAAMATLNRYIHAGGQRLNGLVKRRREESEMYLRGRYPNRKILIKDRVNAQGRLIDPRSLVWRGSKPHPVDFDRPVPPIPTRRPKENFIIDLFYFLQRLWRG